VLAQIWVLIRARWPILVGAGILIFIPVGLLEAIDGGLQESVTEAEFDAIRVIEVAVAAFLLGAGALLGDVLYAGVVAAVVVAEREGGERRLREVLGHLPVLRLIAADLLLGLVVVVGLLLLVVPAFLWLTWFALIAPVIKVERPSVRAAFRRSRELVRGHFWLVFWIVIPIVLGSEILGTFIESGAIWVIGEGFLGDWAAGVISNVLTAPPFALGVVVLYFELREAARSARVA
jgi:hypothetical protein